MKKLHLGLTLLWAIAVIPTLLWWRESILWVAFMSLYANVVGHWSAYQAARAEKVQKSSRGQPGADEERHPDSDDRS